MCSNMRAFRVKCVQALSPEPARLDRGRTPAALPASGPLVPGPARALLRADASQCRRRPPAGRAPGAGPGSRAGSHRASDFARDTPRACRPTPAIFCLQYGFCFFTDAGTS